jgi:dTDP-4-dehydrorhamnose reductase
VGTWLRRTVPDDVDLVSSTHRTPVPDSAGVTADLRDASSVAAVVADARPSIVIHAAMALDEASIVGATTNVVQAASRVGSDVVYVSTDAVFAGDGRSVDEQAPPDPVWNYGWWKANAERVVLDDSARSAVVRLPLVVSLDPEDRAVERIREGVRQGQPTEWFDDELRQPAMAADIADALWRIASLPPEQRSGPWHLPGPERLSRYQIAHRVTDALALDRRSVLAVPTPPDVDRPRDIDLSSDRARAAIGWQPDRILT